MRSYDDKQALIAEIGKTAALFIGEFRDIDEANQHVRLEGVDRTPHEMVAYQLGWMTLLQQWDRDERAGLEVITPSPSFKWNQLGGLYQHFYEQCQDESLSVLIERFTAEVERLIQWVEQFSDEELFGSGVRKWASSTPSAWPIWKWVHINTVAPFKSFRSKIRKWKKASA